MFKKKVCYHTIIFLWLTFFAKHCSTFNCKSLIESCRKRWSFKSFRTSSKFEPKDNASITDCLSLMSFVHCIMNNMASSEDWLNDPSWAEAFWLWVLFWDKNLLDLVRRELHLKSILWTLACKLSVSWNLSLRSVSTFCLHWFNLVVISKSFCSISSSISLKSISLADFWRLSPYEIEFRLL